MFIAIIMFILYSHVYSHAYIVKETYSFRCAKNLLVGTFLMLSGFIKIFIIAFLDLLCKVHDKTKSRSFLMLFLSIILILLHHHNYELPWTSSFLLPLLCALLLPLVPYPTSISFMHPFLFNCHYFSVVRRLILVTRRRIPKISGGGGVRRRGEFRVIMNFFPVLDLRYYTYSDSSNRNFVIYLDLYDCL